MARSIQNNCIACAMCEPVCPVDAIAEGAEIFRIDPEICNLCKGYAESPLCADTCPVIDCITVTVDKN
jgi:Fe-S-cluster-containing hydrogenase component 2